MDEQEKKAIGQAAADTANQEMIALLNKKKAGLDKAAGVLKAGLSATEQKVFNDDGTIIYSKKLKDHKTRFQYARYITQLHNAEPAQRREVSGPGGGPIQTEDKNIMDRVDRFFEDLKQKKPEA